MGAIAEWMLQWALTAVNARTIQVSGVAIVNTSTSVGTTRVNIKAYAGTETLKKHGDVTRQAYAFLIFSRVEQNCKCKFQNNSW